MSEPHPIALVRKQAQATGQARILLEDLLTLAPRVAVHSRRAARLLERLGLERPGLRLSSLLAELSAPAHKGVPKILVDRLAAALHAHLAHAPRPSSPPLPPPLLKLAAALDELRTRTQALDQDAHAAPTIARLTLDEAPPAFFYAEGRGLDAVPSGLAIPLDRLGQGPLAFVPVRGPMLDVSSRLNMIERALDVVLEPIADEGARLTAMLAQGVVVKVALLSGGALRVSTRDAALAAALGLEGHEEQPGVYVAWKPAHAHEVLARLAEKDDVTVAWSSAERMALSCAKPAQLRVQHGEGRDWLGLQGELELDDDTRVALAPLLEAIREGRRYVVVGRERLVALSAELQAALAGLAVAPSAPTLLDAEEQGVRVEGAGWSRTRAELRAAASLDGKPPAGFGATLRPYQEEGLRFLRRLSAWGTGGVLADDMGLGKTVQAMALLLERGAQGPQLVIAPTSVCSHWAVQLSRFAPRLRPRMHAGKGRLAALGDLGKDDVLIVSWALLARDIAALETISFATALFDEAQQAKNATTQRARSLRRLRAQWRVALTGTPLENHTGELWAILDAVAPGLFGTWTQFKARFAQPIEKEHDQRRRRALTRALRPFVLRRKKAEVLPELPPLIEVDRVLDLTAQERRRYEDTRRALVAELTRKDNDDEPTAAPAQRRAQVLSAITRLRLVACHPVFAAEVLPPPEQVEPGTKQRALAELLVELKREGHHALVFSQFVRHLALARAAADALGVSSLWLDGSTPAAERPALVERFQAGEVDAFFLSLKAAGTGLDLVRATTVVHLDPWWNPAVEDQATDRAHRMGQTEKVTVVRLVARGTIEEDILELHHDKRALVDAVLAGTEAAGALSLDELIGLVRQSRRTDALPEEPEPWEGT